jgi:hypothetical protein
LDARRWEPIVQNSSGKGAIILRLAIARAMLDLKDAATAAPANDEAMRGALRAISGAVPSACITYRLLAEGKDPRTLAPELRPEHSPCVQADLVRPGAPGAAFGTGLPRAVAGAQSAWRHSLERLRAGLANTKPDEARAQLAKDLAALEATPLALPRVDAPAQMPLEFVHGHVDAGVIAADGGRR